MLPENKAVLALSLTTAISLKNLKFLRQYFSSYEEVLSLSHKNLLALKALKKDCVFEEKQQLLEKADRLLATCASLNLSLVTKQCAHYPALLNEIYLPPLVLYYKGVLPQYNYFKKPYVAVVGSRKADDYVNAFVQRFAKLFTEAGGHVISGLAVGVDSYAHLGACQAGANTGILGCGVDYVYPYCNRGLYQNILDTGGCLLSEYVPGTKPLPYHFPQRNRLIAGLCSDVFMAQAPRKSGALITTSYALEQNKNVFTFVPYEAKHELFEGNRFLLAQGALPVKEELEFVRQLFRLEELPLPLATVDATPSAPTSASPNAKTPVKTLAPSTAAATNPLVVSSPAGSEAEARQRILECVKKAPLSAAEISNRLQIAPADLLTLLLELSLEGALKELPGKKYYAA